MNRFLLVVLVSLVLSFVSFRELDEKPLLGFSAGAADAQYALEAIFDSHLNANNLDAWMKRMTSNPQHVGSPQGKANAEFVRDLFESWGYEASIETYHVLFPTPKLRRLELIEPVKYRARLQEPPLKEDLSSQNTADALPPFNAYSADGDVTAELVYVNQGIPDDYEVLAEKGISVEGKIVIARYGGSWRGIKPKVAYEHGAIGCILYSDPRDDGYFRGDVYPDGPFKNEHGVQRGSVLDMPLYPGDPLTESYAAVEDAGRGTISESPTIMKIPVLPISYADAEPLLAAIGGEVAPADWRGALPMTYHIGPGPAKVRLQLEFNWDLTPAYNVIARMEGRDEPDRWVMRGNHRDAWVFGAHDPTSGHVAMMEEARAIGELAKTGWRPKRTILFGSWDAEEPGLLGSTEWVEHHGKELEKKLIAYINTDSNGRGFLGIGGSHILERFINQVADDVTDPQTGVSVLKRRIARDHVRQVESGTTLQPAGMDYPISPLGSGSDYTPFLQHLGIASLNLGFGGENSGGSYHSLYDTYEHYSQFGDPGFEYGIALAQTAGRATLRLANAEVIPFRFTNLADRLDEYVEEIKQLVDKMRNDTEVRNKLIDEDAFKVAADPKQHYNPPVKEEPVPFIDLSPIENAIAFLRTHAARHDANLDQGINDQADTGYINFIIDGSEGRLTSFTGLPGRRWFRHMIYAPGYYTGYGVKTLPAVREAVEQRNWSSVEKDAVDRTAVIDTEVDRVAGGIAMVATGLSAITDETWGHD
ncbi:MAG: M28 family peptidase [Rhodothermales bacterium]|nr:M28 family peptidase [Rhodothermales bacterium]